MHYFTPELYMRFNSTDPKEAERADREWDVAEAAYLARLAELRPLMPPSAVKLAALSLHDAEILSRGEEIQAAVRDPEGALTLTPLWAAACVIAARAGDEVMTLIYCLSDRITVRDAPEGWRFSNLNEHWLYDEVDMRAAPRGPLVHRVLLSSGIVMEIPFVSVIIRTFSLAAA